MRHEAKHYITYEDQLILRSRLRAVTKEDPHARDGRYFIRSLYFDNIDDKALMEKLNGVNIREKFRIRFYNHDTSFIQLEKKSKNGSLGTKASAILTPEQVESIIHGDLAWMFDSEEPLVRELYCKMTTQGLRPRTIVDYTREPFIYGPGNVRITMDYNIHTGLHSTDFLNRDCVTIPVQGDPIILEIKWDEYLPDVIRDIVQLKVCLTGSYSKYAACRAFG